MRMKQGMTIVSGALIVAALAFVGTSASANDAGCGLGNLVMSHNSKLSQSLAVTTNGTLSSQLFGITSGTSGCSSSGLVESDQKAFDYAEANYPNLQIDMARGQGESLSAFARLLGCGDSSIPAFGQLTRSRFDAIYPNGRTTPEQMVQSVRQELGKDSSLAAGCAFAS